MIRTREERGKARIMLSTHHRIFPARSAIGRSAIILIDRILLASLFVLAMALAPARADTRELRPTTPNAATSGTLMFAVDGETHFVDAPRIATDVTIAVTGPFIRTRVTQAFVNPGDEWIEGVYVFPLPENAAVDRMKLQIGERFIEGRIEERAAARQIYEAAKASGRKASLLEQERANIFTNSVANIGPGETVTIQIEYQETARFSDGRFSLRFPLVVAPRYLPAPIVERVAVSSDGWAERNDPLADRERITPPVLDPDMQDGDAIHNPVTLTVDLDAGFPLGAITSTNHVITTTRDGERRAVLSLIDGPVPADRDFALSWTPATGAAPAAALFTETIDGADYYLAMITPPSIQSLQPLPREIVFVIDTSGSMAGESIRQARQSLALALSRLTPADRFNVIEFNSTMREFYPGPVDATPDNVNRAIGYVSALEANGGTEMLPALKAALANGRGRASATHVQQVIFLTDGAIGNENALFETIAAERGKKRIFTVGIGSAPNSFFMARASEIGRGTFTHIGNLAEVSARMNELFTKLESPAVTDLALAWPTGAVETWPNPLPDVYASEPVVVVARSVNGENAPGATRAGDTGKTIVSLSGKQGPQPWRVELDMREAHARDGVAKLWARRKIAALELDIARAPSERPAFEQTILETALTHGLVSRLTSLVAVDVTPSRPDDADLTQTEVPLNLPAGWDFGSVFGAVDQFQREARLTPDATIRARASAGPSRAASADAEALAAPANGNPAGLALPAGGLLSDLKLMLGLAMLAFAIAWLVALRRGPAVGVRAQRAVR